MPSSLGDLALLPWDDHWGLLQHRACEMVLTTASVALLAVGWTVAGGVVVATLGTCRVG